MWNNFCKTADKKMISKLKLQRKGLHYKMLGAYLGLNFSRGLLWIFHMFVCSFSWDFLTDKCIENFKSGSRSSSTCSALKFFQ